MLILHQALKDEFHQLLIAYSLFRVLVARELILMEGSDWPFLLYTEQAKEYANQRFHHHHQRFLKLIWAAKNFADHNRISISELENYELIDSCFQEIKINYFRKKETKN